MVHVKRPKSAKRPDNRPARMRYNNSDRLALRKILNLVRCNKMTPEAALNLWTSTRKRHRKGGNNLVPSLSKIKKVVG